MGNEFAPFWVSALILLTILAVYNCLKYFGAAAERKRIEELRSTYYSVRVESGGLTRFNDLEDARNFCVRITALIKCGGKKATAELLEGGFNGKPLYYYVGGAEKIAMETTNEGEVA